VIAMRNKMFKAKKGLDYYAFIVAVVGISILYWVLSTMLIKQGQISNGVTIGTEQVTILSTYTTGEKALLYVDEAAKMALDYSALTFGKYSFYDPSPTDPNAPTNTCSGHWAIDDLKQNDCGVVTRPTCFPDQAKMEYSFSSIMKTEIDKYIPSFNSKNSIQIPTNYKMPFTFLTPRKTPGTTEVAGIAQSPVTVTSTNIKYEINPSFHESISPDVIADGKAVVDVAKDIYSKKDSLTFQNDFQTIKEKAIKDSATTGLDWSTLKYDPSVSSCQYPIGTCACCQTICVPVAGPPDENGEPTTTESCSQVPAGDGTKYHTIPYDNFEVYGRTYSNEPAPLTGHRKLLVYDPQTKKLVLTELEYDFALNWKKDHPENSPPDSCSCNVGYPCNPAENPPYDGSY